MLIDTHIFLWFALDDQRLPPRFKSQMEDQPTSVYMSAISYWEIALLIQRGVLDIDVDNLWDWLETVVNEAGFTVLPLTPKAALLSRSLPFDHQDPADRFIAATAHDTDLPLATVDSRLLGLTWLTFA